MKQPTLAGMLRSDNNGFSGIALLSGAMERLTDRLFQFNASGRASQPAAEKPDDAPIHLGIEEAQERQAIQDKVSQETTLFGLNTAMPGISFPIAAALTATNRVNAAPPADDTLPSPGAMLMQSAGQDIDDTDPSYFTQKSGSRQSHTPRLDTLRNTTYSPLDDLGNRFRKLFHKQDDDNDDDDSDEDTDNDNLHPGERYAPGNGELSQQAFTVDEGSSPFGLNPVQAALHDFGKLLEHPAFSRPDHSVFSDDTALPGFRHPGEETSTGLAQGGLLDSFSAGLGGRSSEAVAAAGQSINIHIERVIGVGEMHAHQESLDNHIPAVIQALEDALVNSVNDINRYAGIGK